MCLCDILTRRRRFRLMVVDRLHGTVAFDDFSLSANEDESNKPSLPLMLWPLQFLPDAIMSRGDSGQHVQGRETAASADASLHAIIVSPVSAYRPQGLAPPPLSTPIIIIVSSSEPVSATEISAAGTASLRVHWHARPRFSTCTAVARPPLHIALSLSPGSWHPLADVEARGRVTSPATVTIQWPQSVVDALRANDAAG